MGSLDFGVDSGQIQDSTSEAFYGPQGRWLIKRIISRNKSPEI